MNTIDIANKILSRYSIQTLENEFKKFSWGKNSPLDALNKRVELESMTQNWIQSGSNDECRIILERIYAWGFGGRQPPISTSHNSFQFAFINMMRTWDDRDSSQKLKVEALEKILSFKKIGIAAASKWICFIDQSRYAIYDSRVSIALSEVTNTDGKRIFPIIGRRSTKAKKYPAQDAIVSKAKEMSEIYISYLETLNKITEITKMPTSHIEMALFMIGK